MMQFGWNPYPSLFMGPTAKDSTLQAVGTLMAAGVDVPSAMQDIAKSQESGRALEVTPPCRPGGHWFYVLVGMAIVAGLYSRGRRA